MIDGVIYLNGIGKERRMGETKVYEVDGLTLKIPLIYDKKADRYYQDFSEIIDHPKYTPHGVPILLGAEDACEYAEEGVRSCDGCIHYAPAMERALFGVCRNECKRKPPSKP